VTGSQVDLFSNRLLQELSALSWRDRNELLVRIGRMELRMRSNGQERPLWRGPRPEEQILGADVVVPTEQGERRGRVICFGVQQAPDDVAFEKSVVVLVPASGTHHEAPGSVTRLASPEDAERIRSEMEMAKRLREANEAIQDGPSPLNPQRTRRRGEKDPALLARMLEAARKSPNVIVVEEGSANHKIVGVNADRRIYLFKTQLRVDISGFTVDHPGVRKISDQEAKDMHLGKVRGQVLFEDKKAAFEGFEAALAMLDGK
jgi:hypothetical protein